MARDTSAFSRTRAVMRAFVLFSINEEMCGLCRDRRGLDTVEGSLEVRRMDDRDVGVDGCGGPVHRCARHTFPYALILSRTMPFRQHIGLQTSLVTSPFVRTLCR
jgi:hypothetical protein